MLLINSISTLLIYQICIYYNVASALGLQARSSFTTPADVNQRRLCILRGGNIDSELEPCIEFPENIHEPNHGLLFIDKFCHYHGGYLAAKARDVYGVAIINSLSTYVAGYMTMSAKQEGSSEVPSHLKLKIPSPDELTSWKDKLPFEVLAVICESDSGLEEVELLSEALNVRYHNGFNPARRNKFLMNEVLSKKGLRTVKQRMCSTLDEALGFAIELGVSAEGDTIHKTKNSAVPAAGSNECDLYVGTLGSASNAPLNLSESGKYCVIKPTRGVASDDVCFCSNANDVKKAFEQVHGTSVFGSTQGEKHDSVLVQEFAAGTEYAIDIVSKNGHHKVAALWRYDKRQANGAPFVYFATELVDSQTPEGKVISEYAFKALDALDLRHGLTHSEFIIDADGVRLVEVNCRQHNTNFAPLTMAAIGYNALDLLLASYLGDLPDLPQETEHLRLPWEQVPDLPTTRACGAVVHLVCFQEGELVMINQNILDEIEGLSSVYAMEVYDHFEPGSRIEKTIDIRSDSGWVHLINDDEEQFKKDYNRIVELMSQMFVVK